MKNVVIVLFLCLSLLSTKAQKNFIDQNYIEVSGTAEMEILPNEIYLKIVLDENDFKNKVTLLQMEKNMLEVLQQLDVDVKKDLTVLDMASNFRSYWVKSKDIKTIKEFQLKVADAKTAGSVIRKLEAIQISNINIDRVDHSDLEKFKSEVKVNAIRAAKSKAEKLAESVGQKCGKAIHIREITPMNYGMVQGRVAGISVNMKVKGYVEDDLESLPVIEFEKIKLESTIQVNFVLD